MMDKKVSVVVPCFNEEKTIYRNVKNIHQYLSNNFISFEIILVDDGSVDGTRVQMEKIGQEIPVVILGNQKNSGKGEAVRKGMLASKYPIVMFLDADLAIPIEELKKFIKEVEQGYDIVIASRFVPGLRILKPVLWYRRIMEHVFRLLRVLIINNWNIKDTQCGFKVFRREVALKIFSLLKVKRFSFDAEALFIARKMKCKIKELPISLQNPIVSHIRIYRDSVNMFMDLLRIRRNDFLGKYKTD